MAAHPYAPGATGYICTEDLVHMLDEKEVEHGTDLEKLIYLSRGLTDAIGRDDDPGQLLRQKRLVTCIWSDGW